MRQEWKLLNKTVLDEKWTLKEVDIIECKTTDSSCDNGIMVLGGATHPKEVAARAKLASAAPDLAVSLLRFLGSPHAFMAVGAIGIEDAKDALKKAGLM